MFYEFEHLGSPDYLKFEEGEKLMLYYYNPDKDVIEWCKNQNRWFSQINIEPLLEEYDRSYFQELLDDWKI